LAHQTLLKQSYKNWGVTGGLRQGDPLSSLIFVLAADLLQSAINKAFRQGLLKAPFSPDFGADIPIIQYADDTLIIMPADTEQIRIMKEILEQYALSPLG
jgi:hypothetical protein